MTNEDVTPDSYFSLLRTHAKITWQSLRSDLRRIWPIRLSKATPEEYAAHSTGQAQIAGYFADFVPALVRRAPMSPQGVQGAACSNQPIEPITQVWARE